MVWSMEAIFFLENVKKPKGNVRKFVLVRKFYALIDSIFLFFIPLALYLGMEKLSNLWRGVDKVMFFDWVTKIFLWVIVCIITVMILWGIIHWYLGLNARIKFKRGGKNE